VSKRPTSGRSLFRRRLAERGTDPSGRRWIFVPYDQLSDALGPLSREDPRELGLVVVESPAKAARRPYHRQKLALVLANLRHFALEQAARGVAVRHEVSPGGYREALEPLAGELGTLRVMEPAERELRVDLEPLLRAGGLEPLPHEGWLTRPDQFRRGAGQAPWRMDAFYRLVRRESGLLMEGKRPEGGRFSLDGENRQPWRGEPEPPEPPRFPRDGIKEEVAALIERRFAEHPGKLDLEALPATAQDAERLWHWALEACLPFFGPYEDAMSRRSRGLFHTRISPLLNLHRLLPVRVVEEVATLDLPLQSREGFVRQVLGWREFVRHVHRETEGFRQIPGAEGPGLDPGDGESASPSFLGARRALPPAYWGSRSGLACLDRVVSDVWEEGWSHHITRLMVLANIATLLDVSPRELTDWFWVAYVDAFDWVVEPNVLGMGSFALGDLMTTKPYVSGAAYIHRMSDFCGDCAFDPKGSCPLTPLYWAFLHRHEERLADNPRMRLPLASLRRRGEKRRSADGEVFASVSRRLARGEILSP
jgi:deoxyribodipyrimidine photolyase-related protein